MLFARTGARLRWRQVVYRAVRALQRRVPPRLVSDSPPVRPLEPLSSAILAWGPGGEQTRIERARELLTGRVTLLSHQRPLGELGWQERHVSHLWSYHLHYFGYVVDLAWAFRATGDARFVTALEELVDGWIEGTRGGRGVGWEPYPTSVRIINWSRALLLLHEDLDPVFARRALDSIYQQAEYLSRRLEHHILGNHLQKNLAALVWAGLLFEGRRARAWRERGARRLWAELDAQVLEDGTHAERTPLYHVQALVDFLEVMALLRAVGSSVPAESISRVDRMLGALTVLARRDGTLHLFHDTAQVETSAVRHVEQLGRSVTETSRVAGAGVLSLPDGGYFGLASPGGRLRLVIDAGEPGPAHQPAHCHCSIFSFELDWAGAPLVVDSGVAGYEGDPLRDYVRSTRAHNTVQVAGIEQSEIWGTFRMARRATVLEAHQTHDGGRYRFNGIMTPYGTAARHHREITVLDGTVKVEDRVDSAEGKLLETFIHLHPLWSVDRDGDRFLAWRADQLVVIEPFGMETVEVVRGREDPAQGWYCPAFGTRIPAPVLAGSIRRNDGRDFGWLLRANLTDHDA